MKLKPDRVDVLAVLAQGAGWLELGHFEAGVPIKTRHTSAVCFDAAARVQAWRPQQFDQIVSADFEELCSWGIELCIVGTGAKLQWPNPSLLAPLYRLSIGVEVMDTAAACRTYNVLALEGRRVVAAVVLA